MIGRFVKMRRETKRKNGRGRKRVEKLVSDSLDKSGSEEQAS